MFKMDDEYSQLGNAFYQETKPSLEKDLNVELLLFNDSLAEELGIPDGLLSDKHSLAKIFSGLELLEGSNPKALAYAGHQFGNFVPQLGDGRAHILGQLKSFDVQLKGSGQTVFSRRGDGRSALGPVIREYILSESMHALGIPTTRALAAVKTSEQVYRQFGPEPAGVFTRVADSHLRVGSFQFHAGSEDTKNLESLLNFAVKKHYPKLTQLALKEKTKAFLYEFAERQINLVLEWIRIGFIHGVMNTDNCSIAGIGIDYGPCAFMDEYKRQKVFSSIDQRGRYSYYNQLAIIHWNILRLADCLLDFIDEDTQKAVKEVENLLWPLFEKTEKRFIHVFCKKLGLDQSEKSQDLAYALLDLLEKHELDFTNAFSDLSYFQSLQTEAIRDLEEVKNWLKEWLSLNPSFEEMKKNNPSYIPRNHYVEKAIQEVYEGKMDYCRKLIDVCSNPYASPQTHPDFRRDAKPEDRVQATFCGT